MSATLKAAINGHEVSFVVFAFFYRYSSQIHASYNILDAQSAIRRVAVRITPPILKKQRTKSLIGLSRHVWSHKII
jgi:hypothetical protein